jgi:hypothetical protein
LAAHRRGLRVLVKVMFLLEALGRPRDEVGLYTRDELIVCPDLRTNCWDFGGIALLGPAEGGFATETERREKKIK